MNLKFILMSAVPLVLSNAQAATLGAGSPLVASLGTEPEIVASSPIAETQISSVESQLGVFTNNRHGGGGSHKPPNCPTPNPVPLPSALVLFAPALFGLVGIGINRRKVAQPA